MSALGSPATETRRIGGEDWIVPRRIVKASGDARGGAADVQLVCGAGSYELDVLVQALGPPSHLEVGGQITLGDAIHDPAPQVPVAIVAAHPTEVVELSRTDEFGEFGFSLPLGRCYGLRIGAGASAPCVLLWEAQ